MSSKRKILIWLVLAVVLFLTPALLYRHRYVRTAVIDDLGNSRTQTVSVAFHPDRMHWKVSENVQGTGTVMISYVLSNRVSGIFSTNGGGDYYDTNVSLIFVPDGQASGWIKASFRFPVFP